MADRLSPLLRRFDLRYDQEDPAVIDAQIRQGVNAVGANLWVLIFAIMVASIGLNVNSTAVIIGAMLISPLMGPIVGIGYGAAINDFPLIRRAAANLGLMAGISLVTAILYFSVSPLSEARSELLARTSPTLWDVLIAFFGGAAGMVANTRKSVPNVVPGVAIATALMPPLCTAGYGIANGNWEYASGAFYLFAINGVFIALSTLVFVKIAGLPPRLDLDESVARRHRWIILAVASLMAVPSGVLAYRLVLAERFEAAARRVLADYRDDPRVVLLATQVDGNAKALRLAITGDLAPEALRGEIQRKLQAQGQGAARVDVRDAGAHAADMKPIEDFLRSQQTANRDGQLEEARQRLVMLEAEVEPLRARERLERELLAEVRAQFPEAQSVSVSAGVGQDGESTPAPVLLVHVIADVALDADAAARLQAGWASRAPGTDVRLVVVPPEASSPEAAAP